MKIAGKRTRNNNFTVNKNVIIAVVAVLVMVALVVALIVLLPSKEGEGAKPTITTTKGNAPITGISIEQLPNKTVYFIGEEFDSTGIIVKVQRKDGTSEIVDCTDPDLTFTGFNNSVVKESIDIVVDYKGFTTTFAVSVEVASAVVEGTVTGITIMSTPKTVYNIGEEFDQSGILIAVTVEEQAEPYYVNGNDSEVVVTGFDSSVVNEELILTVSFRGVSTTYNVAVKDIENMAVVIMGLNVVNKPQTTYYINQPFDPKDLKIRVITNQEETDYFIDANDPELTISGFDSSVAVESQDVILSYKGVSVTLKVTIKDAPKPAPALVSIEVVNLIDTYTMQKFNRYGLTLTGAMLKLTYSDESTEEIALLGKYVTSLPMAEGPGTIEIVITYQGKSLTVPITITE